MSNAIGRTLKIGDQVFISNTEKPVTVMGGDGSRVLSWGTDLLIETHDGQTKAVDARDINVVLTLKQCADHNQWELTEVEMSTLINSSAVKKFVKDRANNIRGLDIKQVSQKALDKYENLLRRVIVEDILQHGTKGRTFQVDDH